MLNDAQARTYLFIANITFNGTSVSWGKNAAYCETTQVLEID